MKLSKDDRADVLEYIEDISLYEEFKINEKNYWLVHGGLKGFSLEKDLEDYSDDDLIWDRIDYEMKYFEDKIIVTGHTPTRNIENNTRPDFIFKENNHIAIDCGWLSL